MKATIPSVNRTGSVVTHSSAYTTAISSKGDYLVKKAYGFIHGTHDPVEVTFKQEASQLTLWPAQDNTDIFYWIKDGLT